MRPVKSTKTNSPIGGQCDIEGRSSRVFVSADRKYRPTRTAATALKSGGANRAARHDKKIERGGSTTRAAALPSGQLATNMPSAVTTFVFSNQSVTILVTR